jgi:hypothetical protein
VRRTSSILFTIVAIASLLLSCAIAALWVRSYYTVDIVKIADRRLHKAALGGGGIFLESLSASRRTGYWRAGRANPSPPFANVGVPSALVQYQESPVDYDRLKYAQFHQPQERIWGRWRWSSRPYASRVGFQQLAWASTPRAALPASVPIGLVVQTTFNNGDGSGSEEVLSGRGIWIPYWIILVVTLILPAVLVRRFYLWRRRARRIAANLCAGCGFDLRASTERCPECGMPIDD